MKGIEPFATGVGIVIYVLDHEVNLPREGGLEQENGGIMMMAAS